MLMNKNYDKNSSLWKVLDSRDRTIAKGIKNWDKQEKALVERRDEITSLKKAADEKDQEIRSLKEESNEKDDEIRSLKEASNEKDQEIQAKDGEITALKRILDVRVEKLKELERIRSSSPYRIIHAIRHPQKLFKNNSRKGQDPK